MRVAYLGPRGTFSEEALQVAADGAPLEAQPQPTVFEVVNAVERGRVDRGFVPFENSIEGSIRSSLDALAFDASRVAIVGEHDHPIRHSLIARDPLELDRIEVVLSHPQANAQCSRFVREQLDRAEVRSAPSTADAVRQVAASSEPWAALGAAAAAAVHGCTVLREGVEDVAENVTRFVWLAPAGTPATDEDPSLPWRTTLVFSELGDDHPGALVEALTEFSSRAVNLTRIESRPLRRGLGRYLFFVDLEGRADHGVTAEAIAALRGKAETVRLLGSYQVGGKAPL